MNLKSLAAVLLGVGLLLTGCAGGTSPQPSASSSAAPSPSDGPSSTASPTASSPATPSERPAGLPAERAVSLGFEDVVVADQDWELWRERLDAANVNVVHLAVGRADWTAFPWDEHPDTESARVRETGRDFVAEAIAALGTAADGSQRSFVLTVDAFVPGWIERDGEVAGIDEDGDHADEFASAAALRNGPVGQRLAELVAHIAETYQPQAVTITELMFDQHTFGIDDHDLFVDMMDAADWPRTDDGEIDTGHPEIARWRSQVVADVVAMLAEGAHAAGVEMWADVRVNFDDAAAGRPESGHDYGLLLGAADRLVMWNYFALNDADPDTSAELTQAWQQAGLNTARMVVSVGLWAEGDDFGSDGDEVLRPELMAEGLAASVGNGVDSVSVTPASMLTPAHWDALAELWAK